MVIIDCTLRVITEDNDDNEPFVTEIKGKVSLAISRDDLLLDQDEEITEHVINDWVGDHADIIAEDGWPPTSRV